MKFALRAQAQSRATWEAVAAIKNPSVFGFVKQANIAHGPQQVNNTYDSGFERNEDTKTKVMEKKDGERVDTEASSAAATDDPAMADTGLYIVYNEVDDSGFNKPQKEFTIKFSHILNLMPG